MRSRLAVSALIAVSCATPGLAADYYQTAPAPAVIVANAKVPACDDARVMAQVEDQFEYGAPRTIPASLAVVEFSGLFEKAYQPRDAYKEIERRYCQGTALISTGEQRTVYYVIEYPLGFAGVGWRAEGCVLGLDPWKIYGANCESLRRF